MRELGVKFDKFQEDIDKRVSALELWQAGQNPKGNLVGAGPLDTQKIILSALTVAASAIALALGLIQSGILK